MKLETRAFQIRHSASNKLVSFLSSELQTNIGLYVLHSCLPVKKSSDNCPDNLPLTIKCNGPVIEGWPLILEADFQTTAYLYKWSGPNGWGQE